ncbi:transcriptional regulator family: Fungal Specific TF [Paecilomyces variotii]|nr:transcriptional regulator family: Fungal Specific TF [Paecilomyces variotii]KAJ9331910.1 transcriptional regulator family: Fungal Specific TF [Paecilomyces variotii]
MGRVEKNRTRSSRSRPVSCQSCRSRKLRCSRQFPCANCTSRGISCQIEGPSTLSVSSIDEAADPPSEPFQENVLARLRRLESIVIGQGGHPRTPPPQTGSRPGPPRPRGKGDLTASLTGRSSVVDVDWLESQISHPGSAVGLCVAEYEFKTCAIREAISSPSTRNTSPLEKNSTRYIWLPLYEESKQIVEKYLTEITYHHHVVHIPSVRALVDDLYRDLSMKKPIKLGQMSLLLAMLASTAFFWTERDMDKSVFSSLAEADVQSKTWMNITLEILEYSRFTNSESLEDIQALIIISFLVCNIVGITSQARYLFGTATSMAWQLSLHRIDHPNNAELDLPPSDSVRAEISRRVWWYLVSTDWQISQVAGLQKGTYMINPRQMATAKPANANDEDLFDGMTDVSRPLDQPTSMSYCLHRIRLGEICREISDSIPFLEIGPGDPDYRQIKKIDKRICECAQAMPPFFSLDYKPYQLPDTDPRKSPGIVIQRYIANTLLYTQRVRFHLPYLSRASSEPMYRYSRDACLEAARMVIRTEEQLSSEKFPFVLVRLKFSAVIHCVCMAIIVLLMDLCLNKSLWTEDDRERRSEIFNAFGILEEAKDQSPFAGRLLESFYSILRRNKANIDRSSETQSSNVIRQSHAEPSTSQIALTETDMESTSMEPNVPFFDDFWQTFDTSVDPSNLFDWDTLLSELDNPSLSI